MGHVIMVDGVNVNSWPIWTAYGLVYTDGQYANHTAALARFPGAVFQSISVLGQVKGDWVDCEPGCVWPADKAVATYASWARAGCRGIYCNGRDKPAVLAAAKAARVSPEIFGADPTGIPHVNVGESQTQYLFTPGYDLTAVPVPDPPAPTPAPNPKPKAVDMFLCTLTDTGAIGAAGTSWIVTSAGLMPAVDPTLAAQFPISVHVTNGQAIMWSAHTAKH